ncbi:MAG: efflux RND transporter periplasmic adaptor subunit [Desulfuromonadales bacterium]|nr:efflux RND transporter periplasmic adaptor subunit [Desulfuromonadales bacterium]
MNTIRQFWWSLLLLTLTWNLVGCGRQAEADATDRRPLPEVAVIVVEPEEVTLTTELSGRTVPRQVAEIRPQVSGILQKRLFTEGALVTRGDVLYQIDPAMYEADHDSARAALVRAEANVLPARQRAERYRELVTANAVSQQEFDDAVAAHQLAAADVEVARAALARTRINLDYTRIKAPISGRIGRSYVTTGALVTANQAQTLATIQQLDPIFVDVTQASSDMLRLKRSLADGVLQPSGEAEAVVSLRLEDGSAYPHGGTLSFAEVTVEPGTGSVTLRTIFPNPDQLLLPGMFVRATIEEGQNPRAILVPQRAVTRNPAGDAMVMIVDDEEKVAVRIIQVVRTVGDRWLVRDGLEAGDRVIMEGTQKARPGTEVRVVPYTSASPQR